MKNDAIKFPNRRYLNRRMVPALVWTPLIETVKPYTMCSPAKLHSLIKLSEYINQIRIKGDIVECGACNGGSAALLAKCMSRKRHLWIYDSFEGLPEPGDRDGEDAKKLAGQCVGSVDAVMEIMGKLSVEESVYTIKRGWFDQTFEEELPRKVALLHCDADWYDSVTLVLETFYPRMPRGGCVVLDDFGWWEGCREAFYDFCFRHGERPLLQRVGPTQAYWIKGKQSNRPPGTL